MENYFQIAVLLATRNRSHQIATRSVPSIINQTKKTDFLVIVDDSDDPVEKKKNEDYLKTLCLDGTELIILNNFRTRGASGAWNTGLDHILRQGIDPEKVFIAILDDDDSWEPDHLESCYRAAVEKNSHMIVSGIVRQQEGDGEGHKHSIPDCLNADDFLIGNPHIQGSNLFLRLDKFLQAGMFDEYLTSATDRDLCIRLADLGDVRYTRIDKYTVHHFVTGKRISSASASKREGLDRFWEKYMGRMTQSRREECARRAKSYFGWQPKHIGVQFLIPNTHRMISREKEQNNKENTGIHLVIGVIGDNSACHRIKALLQDSLELSKEHGIAGLDVLILENGPRNQSPELRRVVGEMLSQGLRCILLDRERVEQDAANGAFGLDRGVRGDRLSIAVARTRLQRYLYEFTRTKVGAVIWILDDDSRLDILVNGIKGMEHARIDYPKSLTELRCQRIACAIGSITGDAPVPFASTVRVQLVDLYHNLTTLLNLNEVDVWPSRAAENYAFRIKNRDYYYDLSRQSTDQLEKPCWIEQVHENETNREILIRLAENCRQILAGVQVSRPLVHDPTVDPIMMMREGVHRGGNTVIFDRETLRNTPNFALQLNGSMTRRSDMIWALVNRSIFGSRIVEVPLPVRQDRTDVPVQGLDVDKLAADIQGYALYSALEDVLNRKDEWSIKNEPDEIWFTFSDNDLFVHKTTKYMEERFAAFQLSYHRIRGLIKTITNTVDQFERRAGAWEIDTDIRKSLVRLLDFMKMLEQEYHSCLLENLGNKLLQLTGKEIGNFLSELGKSVRAFHQSFEVVSEIPYWLEEKRRAVAKGQIERLFSITMELRCLGSGAEGIVLTDGQQVYKYFDYWKARDSKANRRFLRSLVGKWRNTGSLYPLTQFLEEGTHAVLVYPYEPGNPYRGGHGTELINLLKECRENGIVCRNIHPKNLIITRTGLKLIDYGSDIYPYSDKEFRHMAVRAYLSWRWHFRNDLRDLMRRALIDDNIPELEGFERFFLATRPSTAKGELIDKIIRYLKETEAKRILDYGCGKGKLSRMLVGDGFEVTAYDPDDTLGERWATGATPGSVLKFTNNIQLVRKEGPYDAVICSLVVCTLKDDREYHRVLSDLRRNVTEHGTVYLAICNPFFTLSPSTPYQTRLAPRGAKYSTSFLWRKKVASSGRFRNDFHRPLDRMRRDLLAHGLAIEAIGQTNTVDLERFEPSSDFMLLKLRPLPRYREQVSLIIKSCSMEWETIDFQVRHLVRQLEGPRLFHERILAVDSRKTGFNRQDAEPDESQYQSALDRLVKEGVLDRIVHCPVDSKHLSDLNSRWFGLADSCTHSKNGGQTAATLTGFEACTGEYILQVDSDLMIGRMDRDHDYLGDMLEVIKGDGKALTVSLNICHSENRLYTYVGSDGDWRAEVRGSLWHRERFLSARPFPNHVLGDAIETAWHRSVDKKIRESGWRSYRGGDRRMFFVHPPNNRKVDRTAWLNVVDRIESGYFAVCQAENVDLIGIRVDWMGPKRTEPFVFIIAGRNVVPGRFQRCLDSLLRQDNQEWGAVIVDDASDTGFGEYMELACRPYKAKITFLRNSKRRGLMENMVIAIRHICTNPESVIVTLDADDCLIGCKALDVVSSYYSEGVDATVGSMIRTDKHMEYQVNFDDPRRNRGGNIWQHLRTFKKYHFDSIPDDYLRLDGKYIDLANDWAYMIPIIEMAEKPCWIKEPLYLYEPSDGRKNGQSVLREIIIARILKKQSLKGKVKCKLRI